MTAIRVDIPHGVAPPVWMAHVVRASLRAHQGLLSDPPSLRLDTQPAPGSLIARETAGATEGTW